MNRIKRTSVDIKNIKEISTEPANGIDTALGTLQRLEHLILSLKGIIKFLSETPLVYETQRYAEPLQNLLALHRTLRARYPRPGEWHPLLVDEGILRLVQFMDLFPLAFCKAKSGGAIHQLQTIESRKKVLAYAKVLKDRSETILEIAQIPIP